jgi:hypothetical protein
MIDQQTRKGLNTNRRTIAQNFLRQLNSLRKTKKRLLSRIVSNRDNDIIKQFGCPMSDIDVPIGHGIECTGINSCNVHGKPFSVK